MQLKLNRFLTNVQGVFNFCADEIQLKTVFYSFFYMLLSKFSQLNFN